MASILICTTPAAGHVARAAEIARHLVEGGHRVRFLTGTGYRAAVEATGAEFLPLPAGADLDLDHPDEAFPERVGRTGVDAIRFDFLHLFVAPAPAQLAAVDAAHAAERVDLVLCEPMFVGAGLLLARGGARPKIGVLGIVPLGVPDPTLAPFGFGLPPKGGLGGRIRNRLLQFVNDTSVFKKVDERARADALATIGNPGLGSPLSWPLHADGYLQFTVPGFEYPRAVMPGSVHFIGPITGAGADTTVPGWWRDLDCAAPIVHVTQGTIANRDFGQLVIPTIRALADEAVLTVVTTGGRPVAELEAQYGGALPANVRVAEYLPYEQLLPRTKVLVTNGGYGGVHYALAHGVPLVVGGRTEDKPEVCARVAWSGVGIDLRADVAKPAAVRDAVRRVLGDPAYRQAARRIRDEIAVAPKLAGVDAVVADLLGFRTKAGGAAPDEVPAA